MFSLAHPCTYTHTCTRTYTHTHAHTHTHTHTPCRQCSSGLQAIADVAAAIKAGYYSVGLAAGVETMSLNPMAWEGGINPKIGEVPKAQVGVSRVQALVVAKHVWLQI